MAGRLCVVFVAVVFVPGVARGQARVDDHGFPLPDGATARLGDLHFAQPGMITAMALAPNGKTIATAGPAIFLWDAAKGLIVREIATPAEIVSLTFSKDGRLLASACREGRISIWDTETGKARWQNRGGQEGWRTAINSLRFFANDKFLAGAMTDTEANAVPFRNNCQIQLWDVASGSVKQCWTLDETKKKQIKPLDGEAASIADVTLSPSGETMAWLACSPRRNAKYCAVYLYETTTGRLLREIQEVRAPAEKLDLLDEGHNLLVKSAYYSWGPEKRNAEGVTEVTSEGSHAVVNVHDRRAGFRFDYRLTHYISRPLGERLYAKALGVTPDGKSLFVQDEVGIRRMELATGKVLGQWRERCSGLAFFPDGKRVVLAGKARLLVCDQSLKSLASSTDQCDAPLIQFHADGRLLASAPNSARLNVWDARNRKLSESIVRLPAFSADGSWSCSDSWQKLLAYAEGKTIAVRDLVADRRISHLNGVKLDDSGSPIFSGDGKRILVASSESEGKLIRWFDTNSGRELGRRSIPKGDLFSGTKWGIDWYADDGSIFGYVVADSRLALVRCEDRNPSLQIGIPDWVLVKQAERRSRWPAWRYATAGFDRFVLASRDTGEERGSREYVLYARETGELARRFTFYPRKSLKGYRDTYITWFRVISPDGRLIAVRDAPNEVKFFETATGLFRGAVRAPNAIESFDFSPDGKVLATSCADTSILLWDMDAALVGKEGMPPPKSAEDADRLWHLLGDPDPQVMRSALFTLRGAPKQALAMLKRQLRPVQGPEPGRIQGLIDQLGSPEFKLREGATRQLIEESPYAIKPLYAALQRPLPLEQMRRVEKLLIKIDGVPAQPSFARELRALELLERLGNSEARAIVATLTTGHADSLVTIEAKLVLSRWDGKGGMKR